MDSNRKEKLGSATQGDLNKGEEGQYSRFFDFSNDLMCIAGADGCFKALNPMWSKTLGYAAEELLHKPFLEFTHPEDVERTAAQFSKQISGGVAANFVNRYRCKDGSYVWLEWTATAAKDNFVYAIARDITERKQAEDRLVAITQAVDSASDAIGMSDAQGRHFYQNKALSDLFGYATAEELQAAGGGPVVVKDPAVGRDMFEHIMSGRAWAGELDMVTKSGHVFTAYERADAVKDSGGKIIGLIGIIQDITERKRAEEASKASAERIRQSEEFIRKVLDTVDEGFIVVDRDYRIQTANKAYCDQHSEDCDAVVGKHCYEVSHKSSRPCFEEGEDCSVRHVFETGDPYSSLHRHADAEGALMYIETKSFPIKDSSGAVTSVIETLNNITEKYLLEEERLKTQKLESIGTLAGGIAHDFNNLLQSVFGCCSMARMSIDQKEEALSLLGDAEKALHQAVNLTNQLLTFSRGGKPVRKIVSLPSLVENSVRFSLSGSSSEHEIRVLGDLWSVHADDGQIAQVLQNILINADQSMPEGGSVTVTLENVPLGGELPPGLEEGDFVKVSIRDTGTGISKKYLGQIFDPYFTTKEKGSGLGLATSYSIVKNHGGTIQVQSEMDEGSTLTLYLPATRERVTVQPPSAIPEPSGPLRILIMDDEEMILKVAGKQIKALDHECEFARCGEEALEKYRASRDMGRPFDLVFLDLTIRGGMGGWDTIRELREIDPEVKAVVSSGYSDSAALSKYREHGFRMFLKKPYTLEELRGAINSLLTEE